MLLDFDGTFLVILISFLIFAFVMHKVFYLPVRKVIQEREEYIGFNFEEAKKTTVNAEKFIDEYNQKIHSAKLSGQKALDDYVNAGKKEKNKIVIEATKKAEQEINTAKELLTNEKNNAIESLKADVVPLAQQIVSKVLNAEVSISGVNHDKVNKLLKG